MSLTVLAVGPNPISLHMTLKASVRGVPMRLTVTRPGTNVAEVSTPLRARTGVDMRLTKLDDVVALRRLRYTGDP